MAFAAPTAGGRLLPSSGKGVVGSGDGVGSRRKRATVSVVAAFAAVVADVALAGDVRQVAVQQEVVLRWMCVCVRCVRVRVFLRELNNDDGHSRCTVVVWLICHKKICVFFCLLIRRGTYNIVSFSSN